MVCLLAAPWVQLSVSAGNGWPHNSLRHHWLMPISCHFRDCKALLVTSLTHVSGAIASVQFTFTFTSRDIVQLLRKGDAWFYPAWFVAARFTDYCVWSILQVKLYGTRFCAHRRNKTQNSSRLGRTSSCNHCISDQALTAPSECLYIRLWRTLWASYYSYMNMLARAVRVLTKLFCFMYEWLVELFAENDFNCEK